MVRELSKKLLEKVRDQVLADHPKTPTEMIFVLVEDDITFPNGGYLSIEEILKMQNNPEVIEKIKLDHARLKGKGVLCLILKISSPEIDFISVI